MLRFCAGNRRVIASLMSASDPMPFGNHEAAERIAGCRGLQVMRLMECAARRVRLRRHAGQGSGARLSGRAPP
jgi:nitrous oxide reductase accessory protein NosL